MHTADLIDERADRLRFCELQWRKLGRKRHLSGPCVTVKCFEDNALLKAQLASEGGGRVLVVDGGGSLRTALLGDQLATAMRDNGWAGIVVYGAVRDSEAIDALDVAVFALGTSPVKSAKTGAGQLNVPVAFGNVTFRTGDVVHADADGVLVEG
jgi:regulator of ribonuclease activity A